MNANLDERLIIDPELCEYLGILDVEQTRRDFFKIAGAGLIVALVAGEEAAAQRPGGRGGQGGGAPGDISGWIHIGEDSAVTVYCGKVEIGQNIRTALTQVAAEEL